LLQAMGADVIEVGYPGALATDAVTVPALARQLREATLCVLTSSQTEEIQAAAMALRPAARGRINVFTPVNRRQATAAEAAEILSTIRASVALARDACPDVQWSAFDATRCPANFLCQAVEVAIASGATTVTLPDSLGVATPEAFTALVSQVMQQVPNIDRATVAVHCHDDQGWAVANSLAALDLGIGQIEASVNGLGARAGNADWGAVVRALENHPTCGVRVDGALLAQAGGRLRQILDQPAGGDRA
jgi:2-isopropylmalate synthase